MVVNLNSFREISVSAEIRCQNVPKPAQLLHIPVNIHPQRIELIIIKEKMNRFIFRVLAVASGIVKSNKFTLALECLRLQLRYAVFSNTIKDPAIQILICHAV
jgi:hypothetical protein